MRASQTTVLTLVVSLALAGGLSAFLLATPDQGNRPSGTDLGFGELSRQRVLGGLRHAEEHHREQHRASLVKGAASRAALAWLKAVGGSGNGARMPAAVTTTVDVLPFRRWADDLPRTQWKAIAGRVEHEAAAGEGDGTEQFHVSGAVEVTIAHAADRTRRQRVPLVVTIEPHPTAPGALPRRWSITEVAVSSPDTFLRAYTDPVVVHHPTVDVVAPLAQQALATRLADDAAEQLPALVNRYRAVAGAGVTAIWVLENHGRSQAVLGHAAPVETITAGAGGFHSAAWVDSSGDIAVDAARMQRLVPAQQLVELRHALAHVATRRIAPDAPELWLEGIARYEARRIDAPAAPMAGVDVEPLVEAFGNASSGLARLLVAPPDEPLDSGAAGVDRLAALATVAWIEDVHGHAALVRLVAQLDRGTPPARALTNVLRLDARGVEVAVARWTRALDDDHDTDTTRGGSSAGDDTTEET